MSYRINGLRLGLASLLGVAIAGMPLVALAQQYVPPQRGIPGRRDGAGTRSPLDQCLTGQRPLIGIIPTDNFGTTTSKTPVLMWYVPKTSAKVAEVRLIDDSDNELYTTTLPLTETPGIVSVQLPAAAAAKMQLHQDYQWQFSLTCVPTDPSKNPFVEGVLQRVPLDPAIGKALKPIKDPRDRAAVYAKAGLWQDAIATLAEQRCRNPNDPTLQNSWQTLLQSVQLQDLADVPLTQSCKTIGKTP